MQEFSGVHAAAITPRGKRGDIDLGAAFELIDHCGRDGVNGIVLFGEDGEYPSFSEEDRSRLIYLAVKRSRVPVLAGVGSPTLDLAITLAREAWSAGAAAVLLPPPSFYRYDPAEIGEFYRQFARQTEKDSVILLYNTPRSTANIPLETALDLLESGLFAGIADASGEPDSFACLRANTESRRFELLGARDLLFAQVRAAGCGMISAAACAVPQLAVALDRAVAGPPSSRQEELEERFEEFLDWIDRFPSPVAVRTAVELQGLKPGPAAVPLSPAKQRLLEEFREWFRGWLPAIRTLTAHA